MDKLEIRQLAARYCFYLGLIAVFFILPEQGMAARSPAENTIETHHSVYVGGLYLGGITTQIEQDGNRYKIDSAATTSKAFEWALSWIANGETIGIVDPGKFSPLVHEHESAWNKKLRTVKMDYDKSGKITVERSGKRSSNPNKYVPIDPKSLPNSIDPMTAMLAASSRLEAGKDCTMDLPVFDGERRYDVHLTQKGERVFKPSRYSVFSGPAVGCKIDVTKKGGFKKDSINQNNLTQEFVVWAAAPVSGGRVVPVRMEVSTEFGVLELHLDRYHEGGINLVSRNLK